MSEISRLVFVSDLDGRYETRQQHSRAATRGKEQRVVRGVYLPTDQWEQLTDPDRYLTRIRATAETRRFRPVLSHWSAAAIHGLPMIGKWPPEVHVTIGRTKGGRSRGGVVKHSLPLQDLDLVEVDGLVVTSLARTILDVATVGPFMSAVVMGDHAVHVNRFGGPPPLLRRDDLLALWERTVPFRGHLRAREVINFVETRADSALESVSRVNMRAIGCPRPLLQTPFYDRLGFIGETDFDWPEWGLVGEADGDLKYLDATYRNGRSAEQVVLAEKVREDRIRALSRRFSRWGWKVAIHRVALRAHLAAAGLPMGRPWRNE